jgi:hypothetical protein
MNNRHIIQDKRANYKTIGFQCFLIHEAISIENQQSCFEQPPNGWREGQVGGTRLGVAKRKILGSRFDFFEKSRCHL